MDKINFILHLRGHLVPKLFGEIHVCGAEGTDESIFERLDSPFSGIDAVIAGLNELQLAFLGGKVQFYCLRCLIIYHIFFWFVSLAHKVLTVLLVCQRNVLGV